MNQQHKNQPYTSVPELREQLMEVWYEQEWGSQADASSVTKALQSLKPLLQPTGIISRLLHTTSVETTAPHQTLETQTAH